MPMDRAYDVITFDCYGTLIDWNAGIGDALVAMARADGVQVERPELLAAYHELEPVVEAEARRRRPLAARGAELFPRRGARPPVRHPHRLDQPPARTSSRRGATGPRVSQPHRAGGLAGTAACLTTNDWQVHPKAPI